MLARRPRFRSSSLSGRYGCSVESRPLHTPIVVVAAAVVALAISGCGPRPQLICTFDTLDTCEAAASAALEAMGDASGATSVTIKPPDGTWRSDGARYLALAMVHRGDGDVTLFRVSQVDGEPMRAEVISTE